MGFLSVVVSGGGGWGIQFDPPSFSKENKSDIIIIYTIVKQSI